MTLRRDWTDAVAHHDGHPCRVCLRWPRELAHVIPRAFDKQRGMTGTIRVDPLAVVPLCEEHHRKYDSHQLDLEPHLKLAELEHAFSVIGEDNTLIRVRGRAWSSVLPTATAL